jgi:hypothetical protein
MEQRDVYERNRANGLENLLLLDGFTSRRSTTRLLFCGVIAIALQVAIQAGAPNPKDLRGPQPIPLAHLKHSLDVQLADIIQGQRFPLIVSHRTRSWMLEVLRQIAEIDESSCRRDARAGDDVFQFPHVSRPGML